MSTRGPRFGFLGAGKMATALAQGFVRAGQATPSDLVASDPVPEALQHFVRASGGRAMRDNRQVVDESSVIFLAVKPQQVPAVLADLRGVLEEKHLLVSIAAGVSLSSLSAAVGTGPRLVRVMPNTPCLVGQGASGYCLGPTARAEDGSLVGQLFNSVGRACELPEKLLDAVTGLSGSGPAYVYLMIEALADGGVRMGLPRTVALSLAAQTVRGAAEMVLSTGEHPAALRDQVTSPGGTTIAGLQCLEEYRVRAGLIAAVQAATERSIQLGQGAK